MIKNSIILSISVLVSNRVGTIRKCMESIRLLLEQVSSELIVVDTVGQENSDGSLAIAKEYASEVVHFDWCNDFAAARNAGLSKASGEWFLFMDDDEWFESVEEIVEFFTSGEYRSYQSATYGIRNYKDMSGKTYSEARLARMVKRSEGLKFVGTIHETFSELLTPCKELESYVHHYGYAYESEEEKKKHIERNMVLLEKELKKNPMELRYRSQKAQELASYDNEAAMHFCKETFSLCAGKEKDNNFQWQLALVFRLHEALKTDFFAVEEDYRNYKTNYGFNETTELAVCFQMTRIALIKDLPEQACDYIYKYFDVYQWLMSHPKQRQMQMCGDMIRYQTRQNYLEMLHFGAYAMWKSKKYAQAWNYFFELPWEDTEYCNAEGIDFMWYLYQEAPANTELQDIVTRILKNTTAMQNTELKRKVEGMAEMVSRALRGEETGPVWIKSDVKLSIGILVSNNIKTIRNCMESLVPLLQKVSSELIVVDTVGEENSDGSLAVAKEYTDNVYRFEWCNDFAAARNVCFEHAKGEWFLFVDDDEWFDDVTEIIEFFNSGECDKYGLGLYKIRNYKADDTYTEGVVGRFVHRTKKTRFVGKIHEQLNEVYSPTKMFSVFAHHMGYAFRNEQELKAHQERNMSLLRKAFEEEGYTPHICAQIVQELLSLEDTMEEAYRFCVESIEVLEKRKNMADPRVQWLLVASARYFSSKCDYEGLSRRVQFLREKYPLSEIARLFLAALMVGAAREQKEYVVIEQEAQEYVRQWEWLKANPEKAVAQNYLDFSVYYNEEIYYTVMHVAAKSANECGNFEQANRYWKRFPWKEDGFDKVKYWKDMQVTVEGLKNLQARKKRHDCLRECIGILDSMEEAEVYLQNSLGNISKEELLGLLSGMQEAAIAVGTRLDAELGEGSEEVSLLEAYCEAVWQCGNEEEIVTRKMLLEELMRLRKQTKCLLVVKMS